MIFGAPRRREVSIKKEKYENIAVITVSEFKGKGTGRLITLNKKAIEDLGLDFEKEPQVSFSFDKMAGTVSIANTTGLKNVSEVKVAKTSKSVSDKKYFEAIKENFNVAIESQVELKLIDNDQDFNGFKTFRLEKLESTDVLASVVAEAVAETAQVVTEDLTVVDAETIYEVTPETLPEWPEEAPIEHIQEQSAERDVFETVAEETIAEELPVAETEETIDADNPFLNL
jgi:hypothetical protein